MKRQIIAFLSLFTLVVGLSVYYVLMPSASKNNKDETRVVNAPLENATSSYYEMMLLERDSFFNTEKNNYTNVLISKDSTIEEKTNALIEIEKLNKIQMVEKGLQNALKTIDYPYSFVEINEKEVNIIVEKQNPTKWDAQMIFTEATTFLEDENLEIAIEFHS